MSSLQAFHSYELQCRLRVTGPDAGEYLQGQFSNDLSAAEIGQVVYGLWLDRKGKIVADSFVLRRGEEEYSLFSYHCSESLIQERLDAYLVMEDAELEGSAGPAKARSVFGEGAQAGVCASLGLELPSPGRLTELDGVVAFWGRRCGSPVLEIVFLCEDAEDRIGKANAYCCESGLVQLGVDDMGKLAIESKTPQIGLGFGGSDLPQELGLEVEAVSFRKGCYLGQEVMARLHAMGRVRKGLRVVSIRDPNTVSSSDLPLDLCDESGKKQGQLRSMVYPKSGGIGLAVVNVGYSGGSLMAGSMVVQLLETEESR